VARRKIVTLHTPMMLKLFTEILDVVSEKYPNAVVEGGEDYTVWTEPASPPLSGTGVVPCST